MFSRYFEEAVVQDFLNVALIPRNLLDLVLPGGELGSTRESAQPWHHLPGLAQMCAQVLIQRTDQYFLGYGGVGWEQVCVSPHADGRALGRDLGFASP